MPKALKEIFNKRLLIMLVIAVFVTCFSEVVFGDDTYYTISAVDGGRPGEFTVESSVGGNNTGSGYSNLDALLEQKLNEEPDIAETPYIAYIYENDSGSQNLLYVSPVGTTMEATYTSGLGAYDDIVASSYSQYINPNEIEEVNTAMWEMAGNCNVDPGAINRVRVVIYPKPPFYTYDGDGERYFDLNARGLDVTSELLGGLTDEQKFKYITGADTPIELKESIQYVMGIDFHDDEDVTSQFQLTEEEQQQLSGLKESLYGKEESTGLFQALSDAIADMIFNFANFIFNIVQDGLKETGGSGKLVTIDDLVFDQYEGISINYWEDAKDGNLLGKFKDSINYWYNTFRGIAIAGYLIVLLYVGIRILLVTGAKQQQKYKEMATTWVQGIAILFIFPLCIRYFITINHAMVQAIGEGRRREIDGNIGFTYYETVETDEDALISSRAVTNPAFTKGSEDKDYMAQMVAQYQDDKQIAIAFVYLIMVIQFIMLLITYYKRLFMFSYLLVIFPLVALSYAIDKIGDGSAQAFQTWTKEIILNIFVQCFHAITYVFVMGVVFLKSGKYSGDWILTIVGIMFLFKGEEIIRSILGQSSSDTVKSVKETAAKAVATVAIAQTITNKIANTGSKAKAVVRNERQARADRRMARSLRGETVNTRDRIGNMISEARNNKRDKSGGETRVEYLKRVYGARVGNATGPTWAQQYKDPNAPNISLNFNPSPEVAPFLEAARMISNPSGENVSPEDLRKAYETFRQFTNGSRHLTPAQQAEANAIMSQLGLSDAQLRQIADAQAAAARQMMTIDPDNEEQAKEVLKKVNKQLEVKLSKTLFGDAGYSDSREVTLWKRALLGDLYSTAGAQIASGLGLNGDEKYLERGPKKLQEAMDAKKQAEEAKKKVQSMAKLANVGNSRAMDASTGRFIENVSSGDRFYTTSKARTGNTPIAADIKNGLLRQFHTDKDKRDAIAEPTLVDRRISEAKEDRSREYATIMASMSDKKKEEVAENIAVLKDFFRRTKMSEAEQAATSAEEGYTYDDISGVLKRLKKQVEKNQELEMIIKNEMEGFGVDELSSIAENLLLRQMVKEEGQPVIGSSIQQEKARNKEVKERIGERAITQAMDETEGMPEDVINPEADARKIQRRAKKLRKQFIKTESKDVYHVRRNVTQEVIIEGGDSSSGSSSGEGLHIETTENRGTATQAHLAQEGSGQPQPQRAGGGGGQPQPIRQEGTDGSSDNPMRLNTNENRGTETPVETETMPDNEPTVAELLRLKQKHAVDRRATTLDGLTVDQIFRMVDETSIDTGSLINGEGISQAEKHATEQKIGIMGQLMAIDNRERVASFSKQIMDVEEETDKNKMAGTFDGMTAKEYEQRAQQGSRQAFMDALRLTTTIADTAVIAPMVGGLRVGMGSEKGFAQELVEGGIAGYALSEGMNSIAFDGVGKETTIKVYNPYDGSYTDVKIKKHGSLVNGEMRFVGFQEGEKVDLTDARLVGVRTKVANELVKAASENRRKARDKEAQTRANKFKEALDSKKS